MSGLCEWRLILCQRAPPRRPHHRAQRLLRRHVHILVAALLSRLRRRHDKPLPRDGLDALRPVL